MEMMKILDRIDARLAELGLTAAAASRIASGSPDLIRNWRRAAKDGKDPGITLTKLAQVANALEVSLVYLVDGVSAPKKVKGERNIRALLSTIDGLPDAAIGPLWRVIRGYLEDAGRLEPDLPRDQFEPANLRHVTEPSR